MTAPRKADVLSLASEAASPRLPVLFHLMDVSRPARPAAPLPGPAPLAPPPTESLAEASSGSLAPPAVVEPASPPEPAAEAPVEPAGSSLSPLPAASAMVPQPLASPAVSGPSAAASVPTPEVPSSATSPRTEPPAAMCEPASPLSADAADRPEPRPLAAVDLAVEPPAAAAESDTAPTPAPRGSQHRRTRTPVTEDWFSTHGKYIAIGFAVALIGTIYIARNKRAAAPPAASAATEQHAGDVGEAALVVDVPPASPSPAARTESTSPAESQKSAAVAQAELHFPAAASSNTGAETKAGADLFPWGKKADRPAASTVSTTVSQAAPASTAAPQGATAGSGSPGFDPSAAPALVASRPTEFTMPAPATPGVAPQADAQNRAPALAGPPEAAAAQASAAFYPATAHPTANYGPAAGNALPSNFAPSSGYAPPSSYAQPSNYAAPAATGGYGAATAAPPAPDFSRRSPFQPAEATSPPPTQAAAQPAMNWVPPAGPAEYPAAPPSSFPDQSASGIRYERTGSGNY